MNTDLTRIARKQSKKASLEMTCSNTGCTYLIQKYKIQSVPKSETSGKFLTSCDSSLTKYCIKLPSVYMNEIYIKH